MRLIWKKRFGLLVVSYPIKPEEGENLFRVGVYDGQGDMWWFSDKSSSNNKFLEFEACNGWIDILHDFSLRQEFFPNGSSVLDAQADIDNEIKITSIRREELEHELQLPDSWRRGSSGGEEKGQEENKEIHSSGMEEDEGDSGGSDGSGESERDESRKDSGSEPLDSEQGEKDDQGGTAEGNAGHSAAPDQPEESDQETGATARSSQPSDSKAS